tara:strand:+ start:1369 stop:1680 length:312 start_codon:yes stop_codon:yes gene_type:complete
MKSEDLLKEAIKVVTGPREKDYGNKYTNHVNIAELWSSYLNYKISPHDVAICMALVKIARLKNRRTKDCYIDIAGYTAIAAEIEEKEKKKTLSKNKEERCPHN